MTIQTDAVDIPLLLSRKSMKTEGMKIDLTSDTATILVKVFVWFLTTHQPLWVISVRRY